ncbi:MAG: glutaminyl-peptide cyclotransferase [Flavobacterium sp.]|nr:glutaminyl-peptide cyclotransferase [Flavobacterium sp.]
MKKYNLLYVIALNLILVNCGGKKKVESSFFTFDESVIKAQYLDNETLNIALVNTENKKIDSVAYFFNDKNIGTKNGLEKILVDLKTEKCGEKNLKAIVYFEGEKQEIKYTIEVVSDIQPKLLDYKIVNIYPHDTLSFTEGLEFYRDTLYESSGLYKKSKLLKTDYKTGKILKSIQLEDQYFGEGITILNNKIYQLTWREKTGFVYNVNNFKLEKTFTYDKGIEGWGLTNDGKNLYQNDSTERIWKMNPENLKMIDNINVYTGNQKVVKLNELEWIIGKIYSNIWQKDAIAIINPENGKVESILNLADLRKNIKNRDAEVLNGIAYNPKTKTIFVTGKFWDKMFEIKVFE